ncbi:MAG: SDR family oxidoreductase [Verrucomicrobiales bacterium]|nr:SDR family oxidoreductase [Verrucomicrobiales bacterium]
MMRDKFTSKVVIVTGGASGIGLAISQGFAAEGASVEILDLNRSQMEKAARDIRQQGGEVGVSVCDVANAQEVDEVITAIRDRRGGIDILVNNAGIAHVGNAMTTSAEEFERIQHVNVSGVANCLRCVLRFMVEDDRGGVILNLASTVAVSAIKDRFAYSASKGAVLAMTYAVAKDFIEHKVRCNALLPGRVHTPFVDGFIKKNYPGKEKEKFKELSEAQPIGRMGTTEEIAAAALFLCSDQASFITGTAMPVDGGTLTIR